MRSLIIAVTLLLAAVAPAATCVVHLEAPTYKGQRFFLARHADLVTPRSFALADGIIGEDGRATIVVDIDGTIKANLRIGDVSSDLFLRAHTYHVRMPAAGPEVLRSINRTAHVPLEFDSIGALDANMLTTDLYERLDAFVAGRFQRSDTSATAGRTRTIVATTAADRARTDTFASKLERFYAEVDDPWFQCELTYSIASLHLGPLANDRALHERYLDGRPVRYDVPAYVQFVRDLFAEQLMRGPFRTHEAELRRAITAADVPALKALLASNDLLKDDRLNELVLLMELHAQHPGKTFDREGILRVLDQLATGSTYPEHRLIAGDMVHDLTYMRNGSRLPAFRLTDREGRVVRLDQLAEGPTVIALSATWCTLCAQELAGLEALYKEFGEEVRFLVLLMEEDDARFQRSAQRTPGHRWSWLRTGDDRTVMDSLHVRSIPSFLLAEDGVVVASPAPTPSRGLAGLLHPYAVKAREQRTLRPDRGRPDPKR